VKNEPEFVFEAETDTFTQASQLDDFSAFSRVKWRGGGAQKRRAVDLNPLKSLPNDSGFEGLDVNDNIGQFRHL
jgi:hypothetical protein